MTAEKLQRATAHESLLLVAYEQEQPVGFKLGYRLPESTTFYSWLGGVLPAHRRRGIAAALLEKQEDYARKIGMKKIYFTSYERFPAMIALGKKHGYSLERSAPDGAELKYWFSKML